LIFSSRRIQIFILGRESTTGYMRRVSLELIILLFLYHDGVLVEGDFSEVISSGNYVVVATFIFNQSMTTINGIYISSILSSSPDLLHREPDNTCPGEPISILEGSTSSGHLVPTSNIPEENLIRLTVTLKVLSISSPIHVGDRGGMFLREFSFLEEGLAFS
jgi:hypothetical protein